MSKAIKRIGKSGDFFIVIQAGLTGLLPIIAYYSARMVQPVFFAGLSALIAGAASFIYLILTKRTAGLANKKAFPDIIGVTIFIAIIPQILLFTGAKMTSSINIAILSQTELLFTWIICGLFFNETVTSKKVAAALIVLIGSTMVLYNGSFVLKLGDILIIGANVIYPIGNIFAKKALKLTTPLIIVFYRNIMGGIVLVGMGLLIGKLQGDYALDAISSLPIILLLLINGIVVNMVSKILWYEGLEKIAVSKAVSIAMCTPAFSLIYAFLFLREIPTIYQMTGFLVIVLGLLRLTRKPIQNIGNFHKTSL